MATFQDEELLFLSNLMHVKKEKGFKENIWTEANEGKSIGELLERTVIGDTSGMTREEIDQKWDEAIANMRAQKGTENEVVYNGEIEASEWADMLTSIRNNNDLASLKIDAVSKDETGSLSACLVDTDGKAYAVFRGTAGGEWRDNFEGGYVADTEQQRRALDFINSLDHNNITVVGHSKGGNKAKYVALLSDKVSRCVSFDGQGFSQEFMEKYGDLIEKNEHKITNYALDYDFVNLLMYDIGKKYYIKGNDTVNGFAQNHSPSSLFHYDENGNYKEFDDVRVAETLFTSVLHGFVCYVLNTATEEEAEELLYFLGGLLANTMGNESKGKDFDILEYFFCEENAEAVGLLLAFLAKYVSFDDYAMEAISEWLREYGVAGEALATILETFVDMIEKGLDICAGKVDILALLEKVDWLFDVLGIDINTTLEKIYDTATDRYATLPAVVTNSGNYRASTTKRDFTEAMRAELVELCKEVENEPWYDVTKWDIWYRGEKWLNRLTIDNYVNNINEYYRKCIDINDENEESINKIFEQVRGMDRSYAYVVKDKNEELKALAGAIHALQVNV